MTDKWAIVIAASIPVSAFIIGFLLAWYRDVKNGGGLFRD